MLNVPCYNCNDRHAGCHSECEKYLEYRVKLEEIKAAKAEYMAKWTQHEAYEARNIRRWKGWNHCE